MPGFEDLHLDRPSAPEPEPERRDPAKALVLLGLFVVALGAIGFFWWTRHRPVATSAPPAAAAKAEPAKPSQAVSGEPIDLPPLADSDSLVRQLVARLSSHPRVAQWLTTDQLIRNFTVVLVNIADGRTPVQHLQKMRLRTAFAAARDGQGLYINPASYHRYDADADAVSGLDPQGTARLYETLKPRIQDAYRELEGSTGDADSALKRAIVLMLATPVVEGRIGLNGPPPLYTFADDKLELLTSAQRQLLRMGPRNEALVQDKLRALAPLVGIAPQDLPPRIRTTSY